MTETRQRLRQSREYLSARKWIVIAIVFILLISLIFGSLILVLRAENDPDNEGSIGVCLFFLVLGDLIFALLLLFQGLRARSILYNPDAYTFTDAQVISSRFEVDYWVSRCPTLYLTLRFERANGETETKEVVQRMWHSGEITLTLEEASYIQIAYNEQTGQFLTFFQT